MTRRHDSLTAQASPWRARMSELRRRLATLFTRSFLYLFGGYRGPDGPAYLHHLAAFIDASQKPMLM